MTAGLMQLVAYGAQDIYITGNPQITFFKTVYRRYTNFSMETIEHAFIGTPQFGGKLSSRIIKNADLMHKVYLKITVGSVNPGTNNFAWIRRLGHAIVRQVDVTIGGTKIDRQYGTWLDIWYELSRKGYHEIGYANLIGDVPIMTNYNTSVKPEYTLYIPLQFLFNRFVGLSIPLIALQYHEVNINLELENANVLAVRDCNFDMTLLRVVDASLLVDYIYLDTEERRRFAQVGHEYLIEQIQYNGTELVNDLVNKYRLDYKHPTKELFFAMKNGIYTSGETFVYYTNKDVWDILEACSWIIEKSIALINDPTFIVGGTWIEVLPKTKKNVGLFNVSNNYDQSIWVNPTSLSIGTYGITNKISADINVDKDGNISSTNIQTTLTIRDISFPVSMMEDTRFDPCDPVVYMFNNYGILIDSSVNPVQYGLLQLNGHDRFDRREGMWFNYVQPEMHHTNTPRDGVNCYSFAIYPEEHQPSGTANLSRIDTVDLTLWFMDSTFTSGLPEFPLLNANNRIWMFGFNYNVLRVLSGMAGLAYTVG